MRGRVRRNVQVPTSEEPLACNGEGLATSEDQEDQKHRAGMALFSAGTTLGHDPHGRLDDYVARLARPQRADTWKRSTTNGSVTVFSPWLHQLVGVHPTAPAWQS